MQTPYDVVILGGGPAGSAAARLLAGWGRSVLILARRAGRDAMAESLPPSAAKLLERVGMLDAVNQADFVRSTGNSVRWGVNATRPEFFGDGALGWQVRRDVFDQVLLSSAQRAGATVIFDVSAREVSEPNSDGVREVMYEGDGRHTVHAKWVLDCTGRAGILARRGWRSSESKSRTLAIVGVWEREPHWGLENWSHTFVESYDAGWAWSIPVSPEQRYVTVMVDPEHTSISGGAELAATYHALLKRTISMRELVQTATLVGAPFAREASPYGFTRAGDNGILLVGDAASFVDPLSSFGIKKAFASGWLAAIVANAALRDSSTVSPAIELYETREREMHDELERQAATLARDAAAQHESGFWSDRTGATITEDSHFAAAEAATRAAFENIRQRPYLALKCADTLEYVPKAMVAGNDIVVVPHLVTRAMPHGVRFIRNVDVMHLSELAPRFDQVPELYEAYNRRTQSRVNLSDFLTALATLVGTGALELLDSARPVS